MTQILIKYFVGMIVDPSVIILRKGKFLTIAPVLACCQSSRWQHIQISKFFSKTVVIACLGKYVIDFCT